MYLHEIHLVNLPDGAVKIRSALELPVVFEVADQLLKIQFANGYTYLFVAENVIYYSIKEEDEE